MVSCKSRDQSPSSHHRPVAAPELCVQRRRRGGGGRGEGGDNKGHSYAGLAQNMGIYGV